MTIAFAFASVVVTRDLDPGEYIKKEDITLKRPHGGDFGPKEFHLLEGKRVINQIRKNTQIRKDQVDF